MLEAYDCTMPAADPFSALTVSWTGAAPVRTSDASKSCGIVRTIVTSPRSSASLASSSDAGLTDDPEVAGRRETG